MNTPSHIILHLWIRKLWNAKKRNKIPKSFVLWALAPDIGLYLCVFLYIPISLYIFWNTGEYTFKHMFETLYFEHPLWIFAYNILHSPLTLSFFLGGTYMLQNYLGKYFRILLWFFIWCLLHTAFDIPLHYDDGPRIFYPFSDYRFMSPVSYWDVNHYARYVIPIELLWNVCISIYLVYTPIKNKILWKR